MNASLFDPSFDLCLCTFRRPQLAETLRSLAKLSLPDGARVRVIVADNDETPSAQELARAVAEEAGLDLTYVHAPARNISVARNACLDAARAPFLAFIDDDEEASPLWLRALAQEQAAGNWDVVLGPVKALYEDAAPAWMRRCAFHDTNPVWVQGKIETGYSCNVLLRRDAPAFAGLRFRADLGRSGGEDTAFFTAARRAGATIGFAQDALVTERVPKGRARLSWLLLRRFRSGQTHGLLLAERNPEIMARLLNGVRAFSKASFCLACAVLNFWRAPRFAFWLLRGAVHAGALSRLLGARDLQQYGQEGAAS